MASKLTIIALVVGIGVITAIVGVVGIVAGKFEVEKLLQQGDKTNNDHEDPSGQISDAQEETSQTGQELDHVQSNLTQTQAYSANLTLPNDPGAEFALDGKALSIIGKIDAEMDLVSNELSDAQRALLDAEHERALGSIENARVKMSKVIGQQRQLLTILEGTNGRPADSSNAASNDTKPDEQDSDAFKQVIVTTELHLTVFEDIVDVIANVSELTFESKQIWNRGEDVDNSTTQANIAQLDRKYHEKIVSVLQRVKSDLANMKQVQEEGMRYSSSITVDTLVVVQKLNTLYEGNLESLALHSNDDDILNFRSMYASAEELERLQELRRYALERINEDRENFNLPPVGLSSNMAAQIHAEDVFKTGEISHWLTNGEKPYMTYTRTGGLDSVFQNVAIGGYLDYQSCISGVRNDCTKFDPFQSIGTLEYEMMYNDLVCCDDGHKYNIIDGDHNQVSIGLAYNDYFLVIVQNFENNYIELDGPLIADVDSEGSRRTLVNITAQLAEEFRIFGITINYDELPTHSVYLNNKDKNYYDGGETVAFVHPNNSVIDYDEQFLLEGNYSSIEAVRWIEGNRHTYSIEFDLAEIRNDEERMAIKDGVYTIMLWVEEPSSENVFTAITYSVFLK